MGAPLFGIVTAFGFAPSLDRVAAPLQTVVETIALPGFPTRTRFIRPSDSGERSVSNAAIRWPDC